MSSVGFPDWQKITQWLGAPLVSESALPLGAGVHDDGPFDLASWASVVVAVRPTGGPVSVTIKQTIPGGPPSLETDTTFAVADGGVMFEALVIIAGAVTLELAGTVPGTTVDYALYPSNTTTNAVASGGGSVIIPQIALAAFPPANPVDGQTVVLILPASYNPTTGQAMRWFCTYDAAQAVWHVAGAPLVAVVQTAEVYNAVAYGDLATVGPAVLLPRPGASDFRVSAQVSAGAVAGLTGFMSYSGAGMIGLPTDILSAEIFGGSTATNGNSGTFEARRSVGAGTVTAKYRNSSAVNLTYAVRTLRATPVNIT